MRKVTMGELRRLAATRGLLSVRVETDAEPGGFSGIADSGRTFNKGGVECYAPTAAAVKAGLLAAIKALPRRKRG